MNESSFKASLFRRLLGRVEAALRRPFDRTETDQSFTDRERSQVTLDAIADAVASTDFRGQVVYLNKAAERLTGYAQDAAINRRVMDVFKLVQSSSEAEVIDPVALSIIDDETRYAPAGSFLLRRDGELISVEVSSTPIHDRHGGVVGAVVVARDTTAARERSERLSRLALYDHLTGLPNRVLFADRLDHAILRARRTGKTFSVLYIDVDEFKHINDTLGHDSGDELLRLIAERLQHCVRESDTVSRRGGDEFVALLLDSGDINAVILCAGKIVETLSAPYKLKDRTVSLSVSVGIALFPEDASEHEEIIRAADIAMYGAKVAGRNGFQRFEASRHVIHESHHE